MGDIEVVLGLGGGDNGELKVNLGVGLDLGQQLIRNIRAESKVSMGVRNAATTYIAGLTTSLLQWAGALRLKTTMTMIARILRLLGKISSNK